MNQLHNMKIATILSFLLFSLLLNSSVAIFASSFIGRPPCHQHESIALLQFKQSFVIRSFASIEPWAYPKLESWKLQSSHSDCCTWDGVECNNKTGHVIGLDLSSSYLYGSISSNSSLFHLIHLLSLNLADNHFNYSEIPSDLADLSELIHLNLSCSKFSGSIPSGISELSELVSLDLSSPVLATKPDFLMTGQLLRSLVQNLTRLEILHLQGVYVSSTLPDTLANLSSLVSLRLSGCFLSGEFPRAVFPLPNLQYIDLSSNWDLTGHLPEFNSSSPLMTLDLARTSFGGELPASVGNLLSLQFFDTLNSGFFGEVPVSFGNLTQLVHLGLWGNPFEIPNVSSLSWIGKQTKLVLLGLSGINLNSEIPTYVANLTQLQVLVLLNCQITGQIPAWLPKMTQLSVLELSSNNLQGPILASLSQLTQLTVLSLSRNKLEGPIPDSIYQMKGLSNLGLSENNLSGTVEMDNFLKLPSLTELQLSGNNLSLHVPAHTNATLQKFVILALGSCNLQDFPQFLRDQDQLKLLDLNNNNIHGQIPRWILNISKDTLQVLDLSHNYFTGFEHHPDVLPWVQLTYLDLSFNMLQDSLPIPPPTIEVYGNAGNYFTGEISSLFCGLKSLMALDLSNNDLSGVLPQCLGKLSASLRLLDVGGNNFRGTIPSMHPNDCNLKGLTLGSNHLHGQVPRSLASCAGLEFLDLGNNQIDDAFPAWLGPLRVLKVLILRSNQFFGPVGTHRTNVDQFPMLRIIDLSQNNFSGRLPIQYILNWKAMKVANAQLLKYMHTNILVRESSIGLYEYTETTFEYRMQITNKGTEREYPRILEYFVAIDLSSNNFEGEIPEAIGNLYGLHTLNLSNNVLGGSIPSSLGNLKELESLDLSHNKLSGDIPQQITQLNFLAVFDVSENSLTGLIPSGKQFDTFQNSSYMGNSGLCGNPLSRKCGNSEPLPPATTSRFDENGDMGGSPFQFGWKPVVIGYASGLVVGLAIGHVMVTMRLEWFLKTFRVRPQRRMRNRRR